MTLREENGRDAFGGSAAARVRIFLVGIALKASHKARELCLTEFARAAFIRHSHALRVCGKESCFDPRSEQSEKGKLVLQRLALQESDNCLSLYPHPQSLSYQTVAQFPLIPYSPPQENPQHSFALPNGNFSSPLATLIHTGEHSLPLAKFSSNPFLPGNSDTVQSPPGDHDERPSP